MADALVNIASLGPFLTHLRADEAPDLNIMFRIQETTLPAAASASPLFATAVETVGDPHRLGDEDLSSMTPFTQSKSLWPVPTVSMLIGDDEPPHNHRCSLVPLARLLKKMFLGAIWASSPHTSNLYFQGVVKKAVGNARKRMVPEIAPVDPRKAAKLHRHLERKQGLPFVASRRRRSPRAGWVINFAGDDRGT